MPDPLLDPLPDPAGMRRSYHRGHLEDGTLPDSWLPVFADWFAAAAGELSLIEANAMQVATVDADGRPSVRTVLLKGFDERGWVFYTNYDSAKGSDLAARPYAAAVLAWVPLERQVRLRGPVHRVSRAETEAYFASRPRGSQVGAWASPQSQVVASRTELDEAAAEVERRFGADPLPAPPHWGGYRIAAEEVEFWQGRADRLHDRFRYRWDGRAWLLERLAP
ncbi:MAG TPA: pyridoxamine 5'-phosphate oxidase [Pseudonocardia sp.]|nr:pyridoxamine 5'-phosphate oxidase [Pseudonocardia sp.]